MILAINRNVDHYQPSLVIELIDAHHRPFAAHRADACRADFQADMGFDFSPEMLEHIADRRSGSLAQAAVGQLVQDIWQIFSRSSRSFSVPVPSEMLFRIS